MSTPVPETTGKQKHSSVSCFHERSVICDCSAFACFTSSALGSYGLPTANCCFHHSNYSHVSSLFLSISVTRHSGSSPCYTTKPCIANFFASSFNVCVAQCFRRCIPLHFLFKTESCVVNLLKPTPTWNKRNLVSACRRLPDPFLLPVLINDCVSAAATASAKIGSVLAYQCVAHSKHVALYLDSTD